LPINLVDFSLFLWENSYLEEDYMARKKWAGIAALVFAITAVSCDLIPYEPPEPPPPWSPPTNAITLKEGQWANGNIPTTSGEQWFKFTATTSTQYIHANFDTLNDFWIQLYSSSGTTVGSETNLYNNASHRSTSKSVTSGREYYIKVWPEPQNSEYGSSGSGNYRITFNTSSTPPALPITLPDDDNVTELTADIWSSGNIVSTPREQWFKFTATAATQYIHVNFIGLTDLYVQVYNSNGDTVGSETNLYSYGSTHYISRPVTSGQTYYIMVTPYSNSGSGDFQITFNTSSTPPAVVAWTPPGVDASSITTLDAGVWADGNIATSNDVQWFLFTATSGTSQRIHIAFGTLTSLKVQLYSSSGATLGNEVTLTDSTTSTNPSLTSDQAYYIKVSPNSGGSGNYKIAFNTSSTRPTLPITLPTENVTDLSLNEWAEGNIITSSGEQWFKFTATASTQYIHVTFGGLTDLYLQVYDNSGSAVGSKTNLYSFGSTHYISRPVTSDQTYYIKVWPYSSSGTGDYRIAFNRLSTPPANP
jgi:hypothetical protein